MISETIIASCVCSRSVIHYNVHVSSVLTVDSSGCHFKFIKIVLALILGEMGTLCKVLLSVYFRTCLPVFIEIGSYFTDTEQKNKLACFFEPPCNDNSVILNVNNMNSSVNRKCLFDTFKMFHTG